VAPQSSSRRPDAAKASTTAAKIDKGACGDRSFTEGASRFRSQDVNFKTRYGETGTLYE